MRKLLLGLLAAATLSNCAPAYNWDNPTLTDPAIAGRQRQIDSAECTAIVLQSIPLPVLSQQPIPTAAPRNYSVNGTVTLYDSDGNAYNGYYNGSTSQGGDAALQGAQAAAIRADGLRQTQQYDAAVRARTQLSDACMLKRGWVKVAAPPDRYTAYSERTSAYNRCVARAPYSAECGQPPAPSM